MSALHGPSVKYTERFIAECTRPRGQRFLRKRGTRSGPTGSGTQDMLQQFQGVPSVTALTSPLVFLPRDPITLRAANSLSSVTKNRGPSADVGAWRRAWTDLDDTHVGLHEIPEGRPARPLTRSVQTSGGRDHQFA